MKYIQKGLEPKEFGYWKAKQKPVGVNYDYENLPDPPKGIIQDSLLREQGFICCYCCQRIKTDTSHIEHLHPQSLTDSDLSLDFKNMLASCGSDKHWPKHCGNKRGNAQIKISPLQPNCEELFTYTADGEIRPKTNNLEEAAKETIEILGLNDYYLQQSRIQVFDFLREKILQGLAPTQVNQLAQKLRSMDEQGQYKPFWAALSYYLKKYYGA